VLSAKSVNGAEIRLSERALDHIALTHPSLKGQELLIMRTIREPDLVVIGDEGELSAIRKTGSGKRLAVVYRELDDDGFLITAFYLAGQGYYLGRDQVWP